MKKLLSLLALTCVAACQSERESRAAAASERPAAVASPAAASAPRDPAQRAGAFPYEVHRTRLANGLEVLVVPMPADGLVSYWSIVRSGSRDEVERGVTGFAHFFEHCMFRGTRTLPGPEYDNVVNGMGADANAFTTDDFTAYHLSFAAADLPRVVEIEADRFQNLTYDEPEFKTESGAVYGEYRKSRTSPFSVLFEALQEKAFDVHTYKHTTIGFEADIAAMPQRYEYSKDFFQRFYRPENVVVLVAGDVDPARTLELVGQRYGGWQPGYRAPDVPQEPAQEGQRRIDVSFDGQTLPILTVAFKGERLLPDDRTMLAGTLLGDLAFGETSALYKQLVLEEQRVEFLASDFGMNRDPNLWAVFTRVKDPADVAAVEAEIWRTIERFRTTAVDPERLAAVRSNLRYSFLSNLTTPNQVCESLARIVAITGGIAAVDRIYATLEKVEPADVRAAAERWLVEDASTVAVLHAASEPLPEQRAPAPVMAAGVGPRAEPVLLPVAADPNVAFAIWFRVGTQDDPPGKEGLAQLTGSMISEGGTRKLPYDAILERLYPLAAGYGVSVDKEMTVVRGTVHREKIGAFQELFVDALVAPGFRVEDFERLRDQAVSAIEKGLRYSSDEELGKAALHATVFAGTPYGHYDGGAVEALKALTVDDVEAFWQEHWTAENAVVALGGAYPRDLPARLTKALGALPSGATETFPVPTPRAIDGRRVVIVEKPGPSTAISFGYPIDLHRGSREFYALWIANSWLGEHRNSSSHLYNVIREKRGMNYGDYSYIEAFPQGGFRTKPPTGVGRRQQMFEVWIRPVPEERALFALRAALREVALLAENGLTREQFEFTRTFLKNYSLHFAETTSERLGYAIDDRFYGIDGSHLARFRQMMDEITYDEVQAAIRKYIRADDLQIAMVTEHAQRIADALVSDAPSPIDYGDVEKPQEILAEDAIIERFPLAIDPSNVTIVPVDQIFERAGAAQ